MPVRLIVQDGAIEAFESIRQALEGDRELMAQRLKDGAELRPDERELAADLVGGVVPGGRVGRRPELSEAQREHAAIFVHVYQARYGRGSSSGAVEDAMRIFGIGRTVLHEAIQKLKADMAADPAKEAFVVGLGAVLAAWAKGEIDPTAGAWIDVPLAPPGPIYPPKFGK